MGKRLKQASVVAAICLPLLLGTGCGGEVEKIKGQILKEDTIIYDSSWKTDEYRAIVKCEDGKKRLYTVHGPKVTKLDFLYDQGDEVNWPKRHKWYYNQFRVEVIE